MAERGTLDIPDYDLIESFVLASGPGGQNVNKVSTAVELRFNLSGTEILTLPQKHRMADLAGRRLTREGVVVIIADRFRTQERNRADARERLEAMIIEARRPPPPPRRPTKPTKASKERRLTAKSRDSTVKRNRGRPSHDD